MVRIAISQAAFDAITSTLALGIARDAHGTGFENKVDESGDRLIWLERHVVAHLNRLRGPG
jgi:hypothetical protein